MPFFIIFFLLFFFGLCDTKMWHMKSFADCGTKCGAKCGTKCGTSAIILMGSRNISFQIFYSKFECGRGGRVLCTA